MDGNAMISYISSRWWIILLQGAAALVLGLFLIFLPVHTLLALTLFIGAYWLITGIFSIVAMFTRESGESWVWSTLIGIIGILAGLFVLYRPLYATVVITTTLVVILGALGIVTGILHIIQSFRGQGIWSFVRGVVDIVIGLLLINYTFYSAFALTIIVGILAGIAGIAIIFLSFWIRSLSSRIQNVTSS